MASFIEKRVSLYRNLTEQETEISRLKAQLTQLQHLANIGTISHMIAHEINNLLTPVKSYGMLALNNADDHELTMKALEKSVRNSERASAVMQSMLALASGESQEKENFNLAELVDGIFTCLCRDFQKDGITVNVQIPGNLQVWCVAVQLQQALMNLILNARDAMSSRGGNLSIRATEQRNNVQIEIADTGDGINPENMKRIFETFFTTKNDNDSSGHSGNGLGLAFCKSVVDAHDGIITVESEPGQGTVFRISLPKLKSGDA